MITKTDLCSRLSALFLLLIACVVAPPVMAAPTDQTVQTAWRLLDYVAVDYTKAVAGGRIINAGEYAEMTEFAATVRSNLATLPAHEARAAIITDAERLNQAIAAKAAPAEIAGLARGLAQRLITAYPVPLAPASAPDIARGTALYVEQCASCHGTTGDGRGSAAAGLDPAPIAFTDRARARERSAFALYQVIDQGLEGTAMQSYASLPIGDKWALAYYVGTFAYGGEDTARGEDLWRGDASIRARFPDLTALSSMTPAALAAQFGEDKAAAITAFLRSHPAEAKADSAHSLALARERLAQSLAAYRAGNSKQASELALSAYLDGFEPVELVLAARDAALMAEVERAMGALRAAISGGRPADEVAAHISELDGLFTRAETALSPDAADNASTFIGAFTILLREGLEALLIVIAMLAFLRKAERGEMTRHVHAGWVTALLAGVATWWAATHLITISGASRELTEGFGSLLAAIVLVGVGVWMHGKSQANEWQRYIQAKLGKVLSQRSAWFLFALAFIVVYREVFETILFFAALAAQGNGAAILGGAGLATLILAFIAWAMFRFSARLPITQFFRYSSILIAILAVVLAGKGVAALQEAGWFDVSPLSWVPRIALLGLSPSAQAVAAQLLVLVTIIAGFAINRRNAATASIAPAAAE